MANHSIPTTSADFGTERGLGKGVEGENASAQPPVLSQGGIALGLRPSGLESIAENASTSTGIDLILSRSSCAYPSMIDLKNQYILKFSGFCKF